ncbi:MAG: gliding motility-associated C-terminal domain-containing protein, partial [Elusimicrobia bacterium]|nr:gliding motility-associated C-terminal domain-containing protein [Elusimicrobiota bacterium]
LTEVDGLKRAILSWNDLSAAAKGPDFSFYHVERSTDNATFVDVTTQTAAAFTDRPLRAETSVYYRLQAEDAGGLRGAASPVISALPYTLAPQTPFGLQFSRTASSITLSWSPTTRFETTEQFYDPAHPASDELAGYKLERATSDCVGFLPAASYGLGVTSHTEADTGVSYYYKVEAYNDFYTSTAAVVVSPFGDQIYALSDCDSKVIVGSSLTGALLKGANGLPSDIYIRPQFHTEDDGGDILQSVSFTPLADGGTPVKNFAFAKPVTITVRYQADGSGAPVPATAAMTAADAAAVASGVRPSAARPASGGASDPSNLSLYWNNGQDYKKLYGTVDTTAQTVTAQTPNIGSFQIRRLFRDSAATFDISNITTRVITPNGDGRNDEMLMLFDNPNHADISGKVFDLRGAFVSDMKPGPQPDSLQWDGMMNGKPVTSGVYIYQVSGDGKMFNGTCVVAR